MKTTQTTTKQTLILVMGMALIATTALMGRTRKGKHCFTITARVQLCYRERNWENVEEILPII